jgi:uncharacterized protein (DUF697 family)
VTTGYERRPTMPEPFTMIVLAAKWLATHTAAAHAAGVHAATAHAAGVHAAGVHAATAHAAAGHAATAHAAGHAGLTTTVLGTPIAAATVGGVTFLNVYKRVVDDVYDEVKNGRRPKPSPQEMREISRVAYEMTRAILEEKNILMTDADRNEMDSLKTKVDYTLAA